MTFNTPSGTRGVSQPGFFTRFLKMFNKYSAGRIRKTGKFGELPARTYAIGFSRTYARAVGLDEAAVLDDRVRHQRRASL